MQKTLFFFLFSFVLFCGELFGQQFCSEVKITDNAGNEDPVINCSYPLNGNCLQLNASFPVFNKTDSYAVSQENFTPYGAFNAGTPIGAEGDDVFFSKIDIPFNFCFFGTSYNKIIIGDNGVVSFNISQFNNINYPNVEDANPSLSLPKSSIFGVYHDLVFSKDNDSEIYYRVEGVAPCRKLIVNFYKGRILGCTETSTSQIVLSEGSNMVEVFVENKPMPCSGAKFKNSLIGIINDERTLGYSPDNRNTGIWQAQNEAWKFTPTGEAIIPQISWFDSANQNVGTGSSVSVCPNKNEIYTVKVKYPMCGNFDYTLIDVSHVTFAPDFPLAKDFTKILCGSDSFNINLDDYLADLTPQNPANLTITFHNTLAEAQSGANPVPKNMVVTGNRTFYVRVQNPSDITCYRTSVLHLTLISNSLLTNVVEICDSNNDGLENNYQLSLLNSKLFTMPLNGTIHYFLNQTDAENNTNEVITANIVANTQLYVNYKTLTCNQILGPVSVTFLSSPIVNTPIDFVFTTCDFKYDLTEPFEFKDILGPLVTSETNVILKFYRTYTEAYSGVGGSISTIKEGKYTIYVRVEFPGGCFSIATVNMDITFTKILSKDNSVYVCFDGVEDITVNLNDYAPDMLLDPPLGIITTFFNSVSDAEEDKDPISNFQTITDNGDFVTKTFYVKFINAEGCYSVKALNVNLVHVVIKQTQFEVCNFNNDGSENYTLANFSARIKGNQNAVVSYYLTQSDAENGINAVSNYTFTGTNHLFVKILSYGCFAVFGIDITLVPTPAIITEVTVVKNSVCDNNNDGQEIFDLTTLQTQIYSGAEPATFQYYRNYNAATQTLSGLIANLSNYVSQHTSTAYAKVSFVNGGCYSVSTINITLNFLPVIILKPAVLQKCDYDFNLNETFDVTQALPQLFTQSQNPIQLSDIDITYYKTELEANIGNPSTQISSSFVATRSRINVWVRFTSKITSCYSVSSVELQTYFPPKALNSAVGDLCDDNLDGSYNVDLTKYTTRMVSAQSDDHLFSFFYSKVDADNTTNPILDPENFEFTSSQIRIWVRVENIPGCFDTAYVDLSIGRKITLTGNGPFTVTNTCDIGNDGSENIDLTQFESSIYNRIATFEYYKSLADLNNGSNQITNPQAFLYKENSGAQKIIVKISAAGYCPDKVEIILAIKKTPIFSLPDYYFCPEGEVDIKPDFSSLNIASFEWLDPAGKVISTTKQLLHVKIAGQYKIKVVGANGCPFETSFSVKIFEVPVITDLVASGNMMTVIATGSQKILYSIDGINFVESNIFYNLPFGITTFYVKFENSTCLPVSREGVILDIKNAFTPDADGINDQWIINGLDVFDGKKSNLKIFNRYKTKIFEEDSATRFVWNGQNSSRNVNTDAYWYVITLPDGRVYTGWVLLKNRN